MAQYPSASERDSTPKTKEHEVEASGEKLDGTKHDRGSADEGNENGGKAKSKRQAALNLKDLSQVLVSGTGAQAHRPSNVVGRKETKSLAVDPERAKRALSSGGDERSPRKSKRLAREKGENEEQDLEGTQDQMAAHKDGNHEEEEEAERRKSL